MEEANVFPQKKDEYTRLLFCPMDEESLLHAFSVAARCRKSGIATEVYPETSKLKKQLGYANSNRIPYAVIVGENERKSGEFALKNMETGNQETVDIETLIELLS